MTTTVGAAVGVLAALAVAVLAVLRLRSQRPLATPGQRATYEVLHAAGQAAPFLRAGLDSAEAPTSVRHLFDLLDTTALGLFGEAAGQLTLIGWEGPAEHHRDQVLRMVTAAVTTHRSSVLRAGDLSCTVADCPVRGGVVAPLEVADRAVGALVALTDAQPAPGLVRATIEVAGWASAQLAVAELTDSRQRLAEAEVQALRAQISPHFVYNALSSIASFIRTDPERARELILEFADFTRYSFRAHGSFTTLAEELRSIDRYLLIERARFADRLQISLQIAPEVLPVAVPFLCLQPLVENAVRHGLSARPGIGTISIVARDAGTHCLISVEDDGVGMDPELLTVRAGDRRGTARSGGGSGRTLGQVGGWSSDNEPGRHIGLINVDERLRSVFGDDYGLVVETALGAGTKVSLRVPKFHPGLARAS